MPPLQPNNAATPVVTTRMQIEVLGVIADRVRVKDVSSSAPRPAIQHAEGGRRDDAQRRHQYAEDP
jgi:hypothetical protein